MKTQHIQIFQFLSLVLLCLLLSHAAYAKKSIDFQLLEADLQSIHDAMAKGIITAESLTRSYLERIKAYDQSGPAINSFISLNKDAVNQARALDKEREQQGVRGPLHGIPIVIKDNYNTVGMPTTGGTIALKDNSTSEDAFTVKRLRDAGAVILGKANLSELALSYGWLGYSSVSGMTLNPYNLKRNASGSSAGTAAAVNANLAVMGTGTDTAGSIRGPAAVNGLVGIKPTLGLTSRAGVIPASLSFDVTGPIARNVHDAAVMLGIMSGVDPNDTRTLGSAEYQMDNYLSALDKQALKGARIGVIVDHQGANPEVDDAMQHALSILRSQGATIVEVSMPPLIRNAWATMMGKVVDTEFRDQIETYLAQYNAPVNSVDQLIQISESKAVKHSKTPVNPARIEGYEVAEKSAGVSDLEYLEVITNRMPKARHFVNHLMKSQNLQALVFPTMLCPASPLYDKPADDYICNAADSYLPCYLASTTGFPEITVPMAYTKQGLPLGISFLGTAYTEATIISLAYAFEQATHVRKLPASTPALNANP